MASGFYTDRLQRRKPIAVAGYVVTALCTACFSLATNAWHVLFARSGASLGRGVRTPVPNWFRKTITAWLWGPGHRERGWRFYFQHRGRRALWSGFGTTLAFTYSAVLFFAGAIVMGRAKSFYPPTA